MRLLRRSRSRLTRALSFGLLGFDVQAAQAIGQAAAKEDADGGAGQHGEEDFGRSCKVVGGEDGAVDGDEADRNGQQSTQSLVSKYRVEAAQPLRREEGRDKGDDALCDGDLDHGLHSVIPIRIDAPCDKENRGHRSH